MNAGVWFLARSVAKMTGVVHGESVMARTSNLQQKTGQPVRFEINYLTRTAV